MEQLMASGSVWDRLGGAAWPARAVAGWKAPEEAELCRGAALGTGRSSPTRGRGHGCRVVPAGGSQGAEQPPRGFCHLWSIPDPRSCAHRRAAWSLCHLLKSIPDPSSCGPLPSIPVPSPPSPLQSVPVPKSPVLLQHILVPSSCPGTPAAFVPSLPPLQLLKSPRAVLHVPCTEHGRAVLPPRCPHVPMQ